MNILPSLMFFLTIETCSCQDFRELFEKVNKKTKEFNAIIANIAWKSSVNPGSPKLSSEAAYYQNVRIEWQQEICDTLATLEKFNSFNNTQLRQKYLMCRGPNYTYDEARQIMKLNEELQTIYTEAKVCIPTEYVSIKNLSEVETAIFEFLKSSKYVFNLTLLATDDIRNEIGGANVLCVHGESGFQALMEFSRKELVLKWLWYIWRRNVGPPMKTRYKRLIKIENVAARRNGYSDIGEVWREELEMPQLKKMCRRLYDEVQPLYTLLHGVMRFYLRKKYGEIVPENGPIPAHLLGNLWSQNWESLADLISTETVDLDERITKLNWTVQHMVRRADDFYQSLGLPAMTDKFWDNSIFTRVNGSMRCHGTAADMFNDGDFRLLYCSGTKIKDFYVLHHEMGHIQYYMAYEHQPALFRQANSAFHEAIGDTIMYGVMTPQHLHRLGLINDSLLYGTNQMQIDEAFETQDVIRPNLVLEPKTALLKKLKSTDDNKYPNMADIFEDQDVSAENFNNNIENNVYVTTDDMLLLKQALNKIPQIPFSLLIDEYRWKYFEGGFTNVDMNEGFWQIALELQGITPPGKRGKKNYFDAGAKFHVPDNTPYIRYFLASFLQHQLFESLCKAAVFGRRGATETLPDTITMNRCDIYGSKAAGKLLKDIMSRGHSQHWKQILQETTGQDHISSEPLMRYYRPLYNLLKKLVRLHSIPIGW